MTTTEQRLADALRNVQRMFDGFDTLKETCSMTYADVTQALAAYDAQQAVQSGIPVMRLKRSHFKTPFAAGAREEIVTNNGRVYHVALAHEAKGGWYYTVRGPSWQGYRTAGNLDEVKAIIRAKK